MAPGFESLLGGWPNTHFTSPLPAPPPSPVRVDQFAAKLSAVVGADNAHFDAVARDDLHRTTLPHGTRPLGRVRPAQASEVAEVVRIAAEHGVKTQPISCGKNWGYGDMCAPSDGWLIVDLGRMNQIREINEELGYAVIEPGVTQGELYERLEGTRLLLDATGAGPDASIVGNILQRGFGHTPYGDRFRHTCGFEVVLPDGQIAETGFGQLPGARAKRVFPWGQGPWWDGMLTQSHWGIVTAACVWLMPRPDVIRGFAMVLPDESKLGALIAGLRELRLNGTIRSTVHVANDLRVVSSRMDYPWEQCEGQTPMPFHVRQQIRREQGLGAWNMVGGLYGTRGEVNAAQRVVRRQLKSVGMVHFFDQAKLTLAKRLAGACTWSRLGRQAMEHLNNVENGFDLIRGVPNREHLNGVHWRAKRRAADVRETGLIWVSPILPMTGKDVDRMENIVYPIFSRHGFDPLITLTSITERALCCVMSINYDKAEEADVERAQQCASEMKAALAAAGYYSYREPSVPIRNDQTDTAEPSNGKPEAPAVVKRRKKCLVFSEGISYCHVVRPLVIAGWLRELPLSMTVACTARHRQLFEDAGFETLEIQTADPQKIYQRLAHGGTLYTKEELLEYYRQDDRLLNEISPDLVLSDFRFTLQQLAKAKRIPSIGITSASCHPNFEMPKTTPNAFLKPSFVPPRWFDAIQRTPLGALAQRAIVRKLSQPYQQASKAYGLPVLESFFEYASQGDLCLLSDHPDVMPLRTLRPQDMYLGPIIWEREESLPEGIVRLLEEQDGPLIYITVGTQDSMKLDFLDPLLQQLTARGYRVVLSKGRREFDVQHQHDELCVVDFVNESKLLPHVDVYLCHGSALSVYNGIYHGVPMIAIPAQPDQHFHADAVVRLGLGQCVRPAELRADELLETISQILSGPRAAEFKSMKSKLQASSTTPILAEAITQFLTNASDT